MDSIDCEVELQEVKVGFEVAVGAKSIVVKTEFSSYTIKLSVLLETEYNSIGSKVPTPGLIAEWAQIIRVYQVSKNKFKNRKKF